LNAPAEGVDFFAFFCIRRSALFRQAPRKGILFLMDVPGRAAICLKCRRMEREFVKDLENSKKHEVLLKRCKGHLWTKHVLSKSALVPFFKYIHRMF